MMLAPFRTNQAYASLLLFGYALLLQLPFLLLPTGAAVTVASPTYVGGGLTDLIAGQWWAGRLLPPLLLAVAGIVANGYCDRFRLSRIPSQLPGLMLVLFWGLVPAFHLFAPQQLAFVLLLWTIGYMAGTYKSNHTEVTRFNVGFLLGVASLLQPTYVLFVPAYVLGIAIFESASPRRIFQLVVGAVVAYFLVGGFAYLRGDLTEFYTGQLAGFGFGDWVAARPWNLAGLGLLGLSLLLVITSGSGGRVVLNIAGAKNVSFLFWLLLFSLPVAGLTARLETVDAQVVIVPLGMLTGLWLDRLGRGPGELYHLLLFAAALGLGVWSLLS